MRGIVAPPRWLARASIRNFRGSKQRDLSVAVFDVTKPAIKLVMIIGFVT